MNRFVQTFRGLLAYTMWADRAMLQALRGVREEDLTRETGASFGTLLGTMAHILGSEQLWLSRYLGVPLAHLPGPADYPTFAALEGSFEDFWPQLEFFLASLPAEQLELALVAGDDDTAAKATRWSDASVAIDQVRAKFGRTAIAAASSLGDDGVKVIHRGRNPWGPDGAGPH